MKRIWCVVLCGALLLSMIGCQGNGESEAPVDSETESESMSDSQSEAAVAVFYEDIPRQKTPVYQEIHLSFGEDLRLLRIFLPKNWTPKREASGLRLLREDAEIGTLFVGELPEEERGETVAEKTATFQDGTMRYTVEQTGDGEFFHHFLLRYTDFDGSARRVTVRVPLSELTDGAANQILYSPFEKQAKSDPGIGIFQLPEEPRVMILGNSFINTSGIQHSLDAMGGGTWTAYSIGMLTVTKLVNDYPHFVDSIRSGGYDAVFLCGFYSVSDAAALKEVIIPACEESETELILFPAHNENTTAIDAALKGTSVKILHWKGELESLISKWGVPYDELCIDDQYRHSTPLAGYVGAHMIYRAIFGELPPVRENYGDLPHSYVEEQLGDYFADPTWVYIPQTDIYFLT